jgi:hypothetical protein
MDLLYIVMNLFYGLWNLDDLNFGFCYVIHID